MQRGRLPLTKPNMSTTSSFPSPPSTAIIAPHASRDTVAILNYDLSATGTVGKSIEVAAALVAVGIPAELWVVIAKGEFAQRVPASVPIVALARDAALSPKRGKSVLRHVPALARAVCERRPPVLLSGGKHFHLAARLALLLSGRRGRTLFAGRASNSAHRPGRHGLRLVLAQWATRSKYKAMDLIIAVSPAIACELTALLPQARSRIVTISNGVDIDRVNALAGLEQPYPQLKALEGPLIVSVGRICSQKGFDVLIRALASLGRDFSGSLLVIGGGDHSALEALAHDQGVGERVLFAGHLANPFPVMATADLFVLASRWEGASNALIEALALGLPLVATDVGGTRAILASGRNGRLVPPEDVDALAAAIQAELAAPHDRSEQRAAAKHLSLDTCLKAYVETLHALLAKPSVCHGDTRDVSQGQRSGGGSG